MKNNVKKIILSSISTLLLSVGLVKAAEFTSSASEQGSTVATAQNVDFGVPPAPCP